MIPRRNANRLFVRFGRQPQIAKLFVGQCECRVGAWAPRVELDGIQQSVACQLIVAVPVVARSELIIEFGRVALVSIRLDRPARL